MADGTMLGQVMTIASLFVACKVEEVARPLDHVVKDAWKLRVLHYGGKSEAAVGHALQRMSDLVWPSSIYIYIYIYTHTYYITCGPLHLEMLHL